MGSFGWSPGGRSIAFSATRMPDLVDSGTSDIYVLRLEGDEVTLLVTQPGPDTSPRWSPDGQSLVFNSAMGESTHQSHPPMAMENVTQRT